LALPKPDPLKPQPGRREPGARSVRGPKLAEDLTVTPAAHTLDGHTGSLTKSRLNSTTLVEEGNGVPTHTAERSTQYQDLDTNKVYINADGATTWVEIGTGAGSGYSTIQDEGSALTQRTTVDFVGAGVTATDTGAKTEVNIPGGGVTDHGALTGLGDPDHSAYLPLAGGTMSGDLDMDTNDIINARTVEIKDTDGTPVNDVLLRVINEVLEIRNTADSAFRNLSVDDFIVGGEVIRIKASGGTLSLRNYADTAYGGLIALLVQTDTLVERTAAAGVTIDGVLLKDNLIAASAVPAANIDANDEIVLPTAAWVYITCSAASDSLAGIGAGAEGQLLFLTPAAGKDITLVHNGTVVAGKKLMLNGEANYVMDQDHDFVIAIYDATATVWNVLVPGSAGGSALTVQEEDGTPIDTAVTIIRVPNGGLTDNGTGDVSLGYELAGAVTTHAGAADPHTGYRLESANHSHISTGLQAGQLTVAALSDAPAGELGGTWASPTVDANHAAGVYHEFDEIAAPGTPAAAKVRVYAKADGKMYRKDDAGTEAELGGGGGATSATYTLPARSGMPTLTNGCNDAVQIEMTNQDTNVIVADFEDAVDRSMSFEVIMPDNWNLGTVRIQVAWICANATANNCLWRARAGSYADSRALDTALGAYVALTDAALSPALDVMVSPEGTMTFANAAVGPAIIEINRNGSAAGDTLGTTARLWQVKLEFDIS